MHARMKALVPVLGATLFACESASVTTGQPEFVTITVESDAPTVEVGDTVQLTARADLDDGSSRDLSGAVRWELANSVVASISPAGVLTGVEPGSTRVVARSDEFGIEGSIDISVVDAQEELTGLSFGQNQVTLGVSFRRRLVVTGTYSTQRTADLTSAVTLSSSNPLVAEFSTLNPGLLLGVAAGETTITATDPATNIEVRATVQVVSAATGATLESVRLEGPSEPIALGDQVPVRAVGLFDDGSEADLDAGDLGWTTSDDTVLALIEPGVYAALGTGSTNVGASVTAASPPITAPDLSLTVNERSFSALEIAAAGDQNTILEGETLDLVAVAQTGTLSRDVSAIVEWSVSNDSFATVDATGSLSGLSAGTVTVTATWSAAGLSDTFEVTVAPVVITSLTTSSTTFQLVPGDTRSIEVQGELNNGTSSNVTALLDWVSSDPTIVTVSGPGQIQANVGSAPFDYDSVPRGTVTVTATDPETSLSVAFTVDNYERVVGTIDGTSGELTLNPTNPNPARVAAVLDPVTNGVIPGDADTLEIAGDFAGAAIELDATIPLGDGPYTLADGVALELRDASGVFIAGVGLAGTSASVTVINNSPVDFTPVAYRVVATLCEMQADSLPPACAPAGTTRTLDVTVTALRDYARGALENPYVFSTGSFPGGYRIAPGANVYFQLPARAPRALAWKLGYEDIPELSVQVFSDDTLSGPAADPALPTCDDTVGDPTTCGLISPAELANVIEFMDEGTAVIQVSLGAAAANAVSVQLEPSLISEYEVVVNPVPTGSEFIQSGVYPTSDPTNPALLGDTSIYILLVAAPATPGDLLRVTVNTDDSAAAVVFSVDEANINGSAAIFGGPVQSGEAFTADLDPQFCGTFGAGLCAVYLSFTGGVYPPAGRPFGPLGTVSWEPVTP